MESRHRNNAHQARRRRSAKTISRKELNTYIWKKLNTYIWNAPNTPNMFHGTPTCSMEHTRRSMEFQTLKKLICLVRQRENGFHGTPQAFHRIHWMILERWYSTIGAVMVPTFSSGAKASNKCVCMLTCFCACSSLVCACFCWVLLDCACLHLVVLVCA